MIPTQETPLPVDSLFDLNTQSAVVLLIAFTLVLVAAMVLAWAVIAASRRPPPTAMVVSLSLLSLFAIAGGIATRSESAWAVAAAGVGALAGSVVSMFQSRDVAEHVENAIAAMHESERQGGVLPPAAQSVPPPIPTLYEENFDGENR